MHRKFFLSLIAVLVTSAAFIVALAGFRDVQTTAAATDTQGSLQVLDPNGKAKGICPLKHTDVKAEISGFLSRVTLTQEFENPFKEKIEAVYTFPLPENAAVDDMLMVVGDRTVRGKILRREEAQAVYEAAKSGGQVASLLDQERPNIFTQSVANILPGEKIKVTISYVETLKYEDGSYEFVFPMVVGPRYIPGSATGQQGKGFASDTDNVPDASRITPNPVAEGMRAGHDVSLDIMVDAGVPIDTVNAKSHEIDLERLNAHSAHVRLKSRATIPNKDFILKYDVAGKSIQDALLTHRSEKGGYFTLILQPPERVTVADVTPKELVFVLDTSGSMSGFPIEKAKETMKLALEGLYPADTFNLITFSGDTRILFPAPVPATADNLEKAQAFLSASSGSGGTEMMKAIRAALDPTDSQDHVRIACFMTDGYVGNDLEIVSEVRKHPNARVFAFGIGSSVNRFLLDTMSEQGRGEVEYVGLNDDGSAAARRFHQRIRNPLLTDISVDWGGLPVADVYPKLIPDLFGAKPVILTGRFTAPGRGIVRLKGKMSGREFVREVAVDFPDSQFEHNVLSSLWARSRIDDLMSQDFNGAQRSNMRPELKEAITNLGLDYRLMTQFTSFVAVEEMIVTDGGQPRRIDVPVEVPEGVKREAVFGEDYNRAFAARSSLNNLALIQTTSTTLTKSGTGTATRRSSGGTGKGRNVGGRDVRSGGGGAGGAGGGGGSAPKPMPSVSAVVTVSAADEGVTLQKLSPAEEKRQQLMAKVNPSILAIIDRLNARQSLPGTDEVKFVRNGKAEIQVWLTDKSQETITKLKALGFEIVLDPKSAKLIIGRVPLEKLEALAQLKFVRYVAPQNSSN
jgi:Ca-activated chloride channel homolog